MGKSKQDIEIDFSRAISQAQDLEKIAGHLNAIANTNLERAAGVLAASFKGDNADLLLRKGGSLSVNILDAADDLMKVAKNIRSTADIVYRAEIAAAQICY